MEIVILLNSTPPLLLANVNNYKERRSSLIYDSALWEENNGIRIKKTCQIYSFS